MRRAARKFHEMRSDTAKMYEVVCQQMTFFQTVANKHDFSKMARAAKDKFVWKKLVEEASRDLSGVLDEVEALNSELALLDDETQAMKEQCIGMLNEGKNHWQQKVNDFLVSFSFFLIGQRPNSFC